MAKAGAQHEGPGRRVRVLQVVAIACLSLAGLLSGAGAAGAAKGTGQVFLVQAIQGQTLKIQVDGATVAAAAAPKSVIGPLSLAAGSHVVTYVSGTKTLVSARFQMVAGNSQDVVAHIMADANMSAVVTVFVNDLSPVASGKTRLVVSHVAEAPPADIRVDGAPLFRNVANGESLSLVVPAKDVTIDVVPTATTGKAILGPVSLVLQSGTLTRVFAMGDATAGKTDAIVHVVAVAVRDSQRPTRVQTGDGGQAADVILGSGPGGGAVAAALLGMALVAAGAARRTRSRAALVIGRRHGR
jgi:Domain of unknown function (DUF4397)